MVCFRKLIMKYVFFVSKKGMVTEISVMIPFRCKRRRNNSKTDIFHIPVDHSNINLLSSGNMKKESFVIINIKRAFSMPSFLYLTADVRKCV